MWTIELTEKPMKGKDCTGKIASVSLQLVLDTSIVSQVTEWGFEQVVVKQ